MAPRKKKKPAPKKKAASRKPAAAKKRRAKGKVRKPAPRKRASARKKPAASPIPPNATPYRPSPINEPSATPRSPSAEPPAEGLIPPALLETVEGRERALDALGKWFVGAMLAAVDDAVARETTGVAISTFYDIREAAGRGRGEAAGHFFMIDAVGLEEAHRPIPWEVLARAAGPASLGRWEELFEAALTETV